MCSVKGRVRPRVVAALLSIAVLLIAVGLVSSVWLGLRSRAHEVRVRIVGDDLFVTPCLVDAPYIVTHIIAYPGTGGPKGRLYANAGPIPVTDGEALCTIRSLSKLEWRDARGDPAELPTGATRFAVVWHRVSVSEATRGESGD